jgi:regulatory protein
VAQWRRHKDAKPPNARDSALRLLVRREHSAKELKRKLADRGVDEIAAAAAIESLASHDLQSDARFAEQLVRTRVNQGYGPLRIKAELELAGLKRELANSALEAAGCDWAGLAAEARSRKFGALPGSINERNSQYRFLLGRGFDGDQVKAALKSDPGPED